MSGEEKKISCRSLPNSLITFVMATMDERLIFVLTNLTNKILDEYEHHEPSTSDKVDLRSSLRSLQELLLHENYPLEISTLLYLILKDTPEPQKAYNRIVEAQQELSSLYSRDDLGWPPYISPYYRNFFPPSLPFPLSHFNLSPPYYQYNPGSTPLPLPQSCRYPYFSPRNSSEFLSCQPLTYLEEKKNRLGYDPIQLTTKDDRKLTLPSNLCVRETSSFTPLENKFPVSDAK